MAAVDQPTACPGCEGFSKRCADALADEVAVLVDRKVLDARSPAVDALLDYRNPPRSPRSDRIVELEQRRDALLQTVANISQSTPLPDEVDNAIRRQGALLAEVGTLRARVAELEGQLADVRLGWQPPGGIDRRPRLPRRRR